MASTMRYKPSYYNLTVKHGQLTLLFNGVSSGLLRLGPELAEAIRPFLGQPRSRAAGKGLKDWDPPSFDRSELPAVLESVFDELLRGQIFVDYDCDEAALLKERFEHARKNSPFLVTITTTMDCNLGCYYCYENKSKNVPHQKHL